MGKYLNPKAEYFTKIRNGDFFVDKSEMIHFTSERIVKPGNWFAVSRPRRFGKSLAADMLNAYYNKDLNSRDLFKDLKISKDPSFETFLNKYDVIYLDLIDFTNLAKDNKESLVDCINRETVKEFRKAYKEYIDKDSQTLPLAMSDVNIATGNKFIVIIDEWDMLFRDEKSEIKQQEDYIDFLNSLFKGKLSTASIAFAYVTGIIPIKRYKVQSKMNNFDEYSILNPDTLEPFFGFTEDEVKSLCIKAGMDYDKMISYYDGYQLPNIEHIFSPNSVIQAINKKRFDDYWPQTASFESVKDPLELNFDGVQDAVKTLLAGESYPVDVTSFEKEDFTLRNRDDILTFLIHLGYLSYNHKDQKVRIPNSEIADEFIKAVRHSTNLNEDIKLLETSQKVYDATIKKDEKQLSKLIEQIHEDESTIYDYNNEHALSSVINLAYLRARNFYVVTKEIKAGKGRADLVFIPKPNMDVIPMIVELKWNKDCLSALRQIKDRKYINCFKSYHGKVILVGINYDNKTDSKTYKQHQCKIEEIEIK